VTGWWAAAFVALWVLLVALCVVVVALARQVGTLHLRLGPRGALEIDEEGPPLGEAPVPVTAATVEGAAQVVGGPGQAQFLLFVSPTCPICEQVLPSLPAVAAVGRMAPVVIADVGRRGARAAFHGRRVEAPLVADPELVSAYGIPGTPYAVVLDERGLVLAKGTVNNLEQMEGMIDTAKRRSEAESHLQEHVG
jgi:methylamine dehydrogenase accessory protein MauD